MCPVYEYVCPVHGRFEQFKPMSSHAQPQLCPQCETLARRVFSLPVIKVVERKRLRYGSGSPGKIMTHRETGGLDIFIPSDGAMEQDEVDYIAEGAMEKERERVKKAKKSPQRETQARIQAYTTLANRTPRGQRAKVLREAIAESGDRLIKTV